MMLKPGSDFKSFARNFESIRRQPDRNDRLIPMINVVFLLLSFFMIAGTIRSQDVLKVTPPRIETMGALREADNVLIVDAKGIMALNGQTVTLSTLPTALKKTKAPLQLKADGALEARVILPLLKQLSDMGVENLEIVAIRKRPAS